MTAAPAPSDSADPDTPQPTDVEQHNAITDPDVADVPDSGTDDPDVTWVVQWTASRPFSTALVVATPNGPATLDCSPADVRDLAETFDAILQHQRVALGLDPVLPAPVPTSTTAQSDTAADIPDKNGPAPTTGSDGLVDADGDVDAAPRTLMARILASMGRHKPVVGLVLVILFAVILSHL